MSSAGLMLHLKEKINGSAFLLIEEGSRARFARAESCRFHQQESKVLPDSAVALCLAEATFDAWKKVPRAFQRESFFQVSGLETCMLNVRSMEVWA
jgi:hypothetical protein